MQEYPAEESESSVPAIDMLAVISCQTILFPVGLVEYATHFFDALLSICRGSSIERVEHYLREVVSFFARENHFYDKLVVRGDPIGGIKYSNSLKNTLPHDHSLVPKGHTKKRFPFVAPFYPVGPTLSRPYEPIRMSKIHITPLEYFDRLSEIVLIYEEIIRIHDINIVTMGPLQSFVHSVVDARVGLANERIDPSFRSVAVKELRRTVRGSAVYDDVLNSSVRLRMDTLHHRLKIFLASVSDDLKGRGNNRDHKNALSFDLLSLRHDE